jgi:hypothetical protein
MDHSGPRAVERSKHAKREKAIATYASLVGGMILARAVEDRARHSSISYEAPLPFEAMKSPGKVSVVRG